MNSSTASGAPLPRLTGLWLGLIRLAADHALANSSSSLMVEHRCYCGDVRLVGLAIRSLAPDETELHAG